MGNSRSWQWSIQWRTLISLHAIQITYHKTKKWLQHKSHARTPHFFVIEVIWKCCTLDYARLKEKKRITLLLIFLNMNLSSSWMESPKTNGGFLNCTMELDLKAISVMISRRVWTVSSSNLCFRSILRMKLMGYGTRRTKVLLVSYPLQWPT